MHSQALLELNVPQHVCVCTRRLLRPVYWSCLTKQSLEETIHLYTACRHLVSTSRNKVRKSGPSCTPELRIHMETQLTPLRPAMARRQKDRDAAVTVTAKDLDRAEMGLWVLDVLLCCAIAAPDCRGWLEGKDDG